MVGRIFEDRRGQIKKFKISSLTASKSGQMKIQQMSFMLIAVTLFFALVGLGFVVVKVSNIKSAATDLAEEDAKLLVSKIANSPEFSCGNSFGSSKSNCIDLDKVMMLKENSERYGDFWGVSGIEIRVTSADNKFSGEVECTPRNYPECNYLKIGSPEGFDYSNYVALCRKESYGSYIGEKCDVGKIIVRYEVVE